MRRRKSNNDLLSGKPLEWVLTILVQLGGYKKFILETDFRDDDLAKALGLEQWIGNEKFNKVDVFAELKQQYQFIKKSRLKTDDRELAISDNIDALRELISLDIYSKKVLEFIILVNNDCMLNEAIICLGPLQTEDCFRLMADLLDIPEGQTRSCFGRKGQLESSGLVTLKHKDCIWFHRKISTISQQFCEGMTQPGMTIKKLLAGVLAYPPKALLTLDDYAHVAQVDILKSYLKTTSKQQKTGVNIFVYGYPGTGKTQLARVLAEDLGRNLYEVCFEDSHGDPIDGFERFQALVVGQRVLASSDALLVFDEAEDVFNHGGSSDKSVAKKHKAWVNRTLEETAVPVIWLSNSCHIDGAFLRRFDMVIHLDVPPESQRKKLLAKICEDKLDPGALGYLTKSDNLSPAIMQRAVDVGLSLKDEINGEQLPKVVGDIVCSTLKAQGVTVPRPDRSGRVDLGFAPELLNCNLDPAEICQGIVRSPSARICLYGPPGTGKTEFGRWLAKQLDKKLLLKKASDLLGMYVGESEQNIATAFAEAEELDAILQIDEVDSFLRDRREAKQSWETTQVNEMLTQMEAYPGVLIVSTNLMEELDQAALRRFDLKLKLGYLRPEAGAVMLQKACAHLDLEGPGPECLERLAKLDNLTPGDFATVTRQATFNPATEAKQLVDRLTTESGLKAGTRSQTIGFIH